MLTDSRSFLIIFLTSHYEYATANNSPHRDEIYNKEMKYKGHILTVYSEDGFPKGHAAAFYEKT